LTTQAQKTVKLDFIFSITQTIFESFKTYTDAQATTESIQNFFDAIKLDVDQFFKLITSMLVYPNNHSKIEESLYGNLFNTELIRDLEVIYTATAQKFITALEHCLKRMSEKKGLLLFKTLDQFRLKK